MKAEKNMNVVITETEWFHRLRDFLKALSVEIVIEESAIYFYDIKNDGIGLLVNTVMPNMGKNYVYDNKISEKDFLAAEEINIKGARISFRLQQMNGELILTWFKNIEYGENFDSKKENEGRLDFKADLPIRFSCANGRTVINVGKSAASIQLVDKRRAYIDSNGIHYSSLKLTEINALLKDPLYISFINYYSNICPGLANYISYVGDLAKQAELLKDFLGGLGIIVIDSGDSLLFKKDGKELKVFIAGNLVPTIEYPTSGLLHGDSITLCETDKYDEYICSLTFSGARTSDKGIYINNFSCILEGEEYWGQLYPDTNVTLTAGSSTESMTLSGEQIQRFYNGEFQQSFVLCSEEGKKYLSDLALKSKFYGVWLKYALSNDCSYVDEVFGATGEQFVLTGFQD